MCRFIALIIKKDCYFMRFLAFLSCFLLEMVVLWLFIYKMMVVVVGWILNCVKMTIGKTVCLAILLF